MLYLEVVILYVGRDNTILLEVVAETNILSDWV